MDAEVPAALELLRERVLHALRPVPEHKGAKAARKVNVGISIEVRDARARGTLDVDRVGHGDRLHHLHREYLGASCLRLGGAGSARGEAVVRACKVLSFRGFGL